MRPEWVRAIKDQCDEQHVAFFFKQWGAHNEAGKRVGKGKAGRILDGATCDELPQKSKREGWRETGNSSTNSRLQISDVISSPTR